MFAIKYLGYVKLARVGNAVKKIRNLVKAKVSQNLQVERRNKKRETWDSQEQKFLFISSSKIH